MPMQRFDTATARTRTASLPALRGLLASAAVLLVACAAAPPPSGSPIDPGPDPAAGARAGEPLPGLSAAELALFEQGKEAFAEFDTVTGSNGTSQGLGPRFNLDGCAGCHSFPAMGGSSPKRNPEPQVAHAAGAHNPAVIPFLHADGPVVEARFKWLMDAKGNFVRDSAPDASGGRQADGGVHALFTIAGRSDAGDCQLAQPPLERAWARDNVSLRIPTPVFGLGLIEAVEESAIVANSLDYMRHESAAPMVARTHMYEQLGIIGRPGRGRENRSGNDGTITRFGWKAQNKSLLLFAGEAYNVEQGVTNELFPNERDGEAVPLPAACKTNATPEDDSQIDHPEPPAGVASDIIRFELFMRLLAPPRPACDVTTAGSCPANIVRGSEVFDSAYCSACHTRRLPIGRSSIAAIEAQRYAALYSDLLLHRMGSCPPNADHTARCLADDIAQGQARGDEFRTAPLWGVGQRLFFMHDGRARDLPAAILAHRGPGSEANEVIRRYQALPVRARQDLIDFLRSL